MKQDDKELLYKDLSSRLPYGTVVECSIESGESIDLILTTSHIDELLNESLIIKPYLRTLDSMTKEERKERLSFFQIVELNSGLTPLLSALKSFEYIDWLNAHQFDYHGLIPMGLAIEVTKENNPYEKIKL